MREDSQSTDYTAESAYVEVAAEMFRLLADPTRIRIILALRDGEVSVNHLADIVDKSPTVVSQHLAKLRLARMVQVRKEGTTAFYSLVDEHARFLVVEAVLQAQHAVDEPRHHLGSLTADDVRRTVVEESKAPVTD